MKEKTEATQTTKIRVSTHGNLKVLAALRKQSMMDTLDRLIKADLEQVRKEVNHEHENL